MRKIKVSDYIIDTLIQHGSTQVFGYIGGTIAHLLDSIYLNLQIEMVNTLHEQGAGFAAEGYARTTGKIGVALATSGPGAINLLTPLGSCFFDSVPTLFITGQVNTYEYKGTMPIRQKGFQETDIVSMTRPISKYSVWVDDAQQIRYELEKALYLAQAGRKSPVHVDIPMDVQRAELVIEDLPSFYNSDEHLRLEAENTQASADFSSVWETLVNAERPVVLVGGGIRSSGVTDALRAFLDASRLPVVTSLMGVDAVPADYPYHYGLIGAYGNRYGNLTLANADVILTLGSRLDLRQTGTNKALFAPYARIIRVDTDLAELDHNEFPNVLGVRADLKTALEGLNAVAHPLDMPTWTQRLQAYKAQFPAETALDGSPKLQNQVVSLISKHARADDVIVADVGQHQMWVAQSWQVQAEQRVLFSGGMGAMGFALPASIGATLATSKRCIVLCGDGGLQMNIQELEVLKRRNLPIKIIVLNNFNLGMVRQFQEIYFDNRCPSTLDDYSVPNFEAIAKAYGIGGQTLREAESLSLEEIDTVIQAFLADNAPALLDIHLPVATTVEPKLIVNKPIEDMYPFLPEKDLASLMLPSTSNKIASPESLSHD